MAGTASGPLRILNYSSNARTREQVQLALGTRIHPDLPELSYTDVATAPMVIQLMDAGGFDLVILDGEATMAELDQIHDVANNIMGNTICAFGEGTAMPALGFMKKFRKEFEQYVRGERKRKDATLVVG